MLIKWVTSAASNDADSEKTEVLMQNTTQNRDPKSSDATIMPEQEQKPSSGKDTQHRPLSKDLEKSQEQNR